MLRPYDVETVLVEVEHRLNSGPLTYMAEENFAALITLCHLLHVATSTDRTTISAVL